VEGQFLDVDELTAVPHPVQTLLDENFRAVKIVAGDNISAAISDAGELRVWGSFRVGVFLIVCASSHVLSG
jgi:regulator of chromosome condensation